jgi:hypothetical protein
MKPFCLLLLAVLSSACLERDLAPLNPCLVSTVSRKVTVTSIDRVDLLFMVDNSASMTSKQNSLKAQFPRMIQVLSTGMRSANDPSPFPPVRDMHLAVVSSDMGVVGQSGIMGCDPNGGDDGRLKHVSSGDPGCQATYPPFLSYDAARDNPMQIGVDFGCIASLGAMGCTYENQLESPFKALWPKVAADKDGNVLPPNTYTFLAPAGGFTTGRGDTPPPEGSAGFMRKDPADPAVLGIILLTDEDDQSSQNTNYLSTSDPSANQAVQVRPAMNAQNLYPVQRYIDGFKKLRPGEENLVVFAAIAGVPTDLVDARARMNVDFTDTTQRNAYYDKIAMDRRMQPTVMNGLGQGAAFAPACQRTNAMRQAETATPARRILEVVRGFGENGTIQSICADDYGPGMDAIIEIIARQLGAVCLPRPLIRRADGLVPCNVVWELPKVGTAPPGTPVTCAELPFLKPVDAGRPAFNAQGGANCKVEQLPVSGDTVPAGAGWFYDTFSPGVMSSCPRDRQQRVTFTDSAKPSNGVSIKLECLNEVQSQPLLRKDVNTSTPQPTIGSACSMSSAPATAPTTPTSSRTGAGRTRTMTNAASMAPSACAVQLRGGGTDTTMFCHPELNVCVQGCKTSDDCPAAWVCDERDETTAMTNGRPYCTNPTCGGG